MILVPPEKLMLIGPSKVLIGSKVTLQCESSPSVPATTLSWRVEQDGKTAVKPSDVTAYLNDYAANKKDKFERKVTIKKVYNHPSYHSTSSGAPRNDITLLETNEDLFGDNIQGNAAPACLPAKGTILIDN